MAFNGESGRLQASHAAWTYRLSQFCAGNVKLDLSNGVCSKEIRSRFASLEPAEQTVAF